MVSSPTNENSPVPDDVVFKAQEIFEAELACWQIVGPMAERRPNLPDREFWNVVRRDPAPATIIQVEPMENTSEVKIIHLQSKEYAYSCIRWHGIRAVLEAIRTGDCPLQS